MLLISATLRSRDSPAVPQQLAGRVLAQRGEQVAGLHVL